MSDRLKGRVAIVTHANRWLGAAAARALAAQGASLLLAFRGEPHAGPEVEWIVDRGGLAAATEIDLADPGAAQTLFERAEESFGSVSILVHVAADGERDSLLPQGLRTRDRSGRRLAPLAPESFDAQVATTARSGALLLAEFTRRHVARGAREGSVVCVTRNDPRRFEEAVSTGASQAALESVCRSGATALARYGIRVNVLRAFVEEGGVDPAEAADVVEFLASRLSRGVTGQVIELNAGSTED